MYGVEVASWSGPGSTGRAQFLADRINSADNTARPGRTQEMARLQEELNQVRGQFGAAKQRVAQLEQSGFAKNATVINSKHLVDICRMADNLSSVVRTPGGNATLRITVKRLLTGHRRALDVARAILLSEIGKAEDHQKPLATTLDNEL